MPWCPDDGIRENSTCVPLDPRHHHRYPQSRYSAARLSRVFTGEADQRNAEKHVDEVSCRRCSAQDALLGSSLRSCRDCVFKFYRDESLIKSNLERNHVLAKPRLAANKIASKVY